MTAAGPRNVTARLRFEVLRRDGHRCHYCGTTAEQVQLTVDHVVPIALGGADDPTNLVAACPSCNAGKAATGPGEQVVEAVDERAERWAAAIERAAEIQSALRGDQERYVQLFDEAWCEWTHHDGTPGMRPTDWRASVGVWHDAGLEVETLIELVDAVMPRRIPSRRMWRYFCGAVWGTLRERQAIAQGLLQGGDV